MSSEKENPLRILWIVPKSPLPGIDGATHATSSLLSALSNLGVHIDLVFFHPEELSERGLELEAQELSFDDFRRQLGVSAIIVLPKKQPPRSYFIRSLVSSVRSVRDPRMPLTMFPYATGNISETFQALFEGRIKKLKELGVTGDMSELTPTWSAVVYDGLHGSAHLFDGKRMTLPEGYPPVFYRAHNVEGDIWRGKAKESANFVMSRAVAGQAHLVKEFELALLRKTAGVLPVSREDADRFREILPRVHQMIAPISFAFSDTQPKREPEIGRFLFVGRLDWEPNKQGLLWLLQEVWPEVVERKPEQQLVIIGRGDGRYLKNFTKLPGVQILGEVEDLGEEYQRAEAALVPLLFGSGTRVKILEASEYGCPVVSTSLGSQGLPLLDDVSILEAENVSDWITRLTSEVHQGIGIKAREDLKQFCDPIGIGKETLRFISEALRGA